MREARLRVKPRVTQADLSARCATYDVQLDRAVIAKIEAGTRPVLDYEARAIAASLYVSVGWLVGEEELYESAEAVPHPTGARPPRS